MGNKFATLNIRPAYSSERDYYSAREAEWVRTYPVYFPGANPKATGRCWTGILNRSITPGARTKIEWIKAGRILFRERDYTSDLL